MDDGIGRVGMITHWHYGIEYPVKCNDGDVGLQDVTYYVSASTLKDKILVKARCTRITTDTVEDSVKMQYLFDALESCAIETCSRIMKSWIQVEPSPKKEGASSNETFANGMTRASIESCKDIKQLRKIALQLLQRLKSKPTRLENTVRPAGRAKSMPLTFENLIDVLIKEFPHLEERERHQCKDEIENFPPFIPGEQHRNPESRLAQLMSLWERFVNSLENRTRDKREMPAEYSFFDPRRLLGLYLNGYPADFTNAISMHIIAQPEALRDNKNFFQKMTNILTHMRNVKDGRYQNVMRLALCKNLPYNGAVTVVVEPNKRARYER